MSDQMLLDESARSAALDPTRSFIVQAPAGSGKTGLLIQRYLALLSIADKPEEVLAITFTRKAAAEMRTRILSLLSSANTTEGISQISAYGKKSYELALQAKARDEEKTWGLMQNPNRMQILTIDAFCSRLVSAMPVASRFGGMPDLVENADEIYRTAVDRYFTSFLNSKFSEQHLEIVLLQFNNDFERVADLLIRLLAKRDQWLPYVTDDGLINTYQLNEALEAALEQDLNPLTHLLPQQTAEEIAAMVSYAAESMRIADIKSDVLACKDLNVLPVPSLSSINIWRGIRKLLLTDTGTLRKSVTKREGFPAASSSDNPDIRLRYKQFKERMLELLKLLQSETKFIEHLNLVADMPTKTYTEDDQKFLSSLFSILKTLTAELLVEFQLSGQIDFIELTSSALRSLGADEEPTDLALVFDAKIKHILIDEFQDTSKLHLELLRKLTLGWQEDNRSLFIVGDPMQSIYKFRDANVANFIRIKNRGVNSISPEYLQLSANFRSDGNLIDLNNRIFKDIFDKNDDLRTGEIKFHPAQAVRASNDTAGVTLHATSSDDLNIEVKSIIELLRNIQAEDKNSTIGILVRSRTHLENLLPELRKNGFVSEVAGMEKLSTRQEVLDVYSLCMALVSPADTQAWLSVLRAPWCGLSLRELELIVSSGNNNLILENLRDQSILNSLSEVSVKRVQLLLDAYHSAFSMLHTDQLGIIVEGLWESLGGYSTLDSVEKVNNVEKFFNLLRTQTIASVLNFTKPLSSHLEDFTKKSQVNLHGNIRVMTIHMSKGLEFDYVILPSTSRSSQQNDSDLLVWQELVDAGDNMHLLLAAKQTTDDSSLYAYIQKRHNRLDAAELKRLFYVAMTRSVKRTHIFCTGKFKESNVKFNHPKGSFLSLLQSCLRDIETKTYFSDAELIPETELKEFKRQRLISAKNDRLIKNISIGGKPSEANLSDVVEYEWASETAMHIGTVVHLALKQLGTGEVNDWLEANHVDKKSHFSRVLRALGVPDIELEDAVNRTVLAINAAATDTQREWIFSSAHSLIENEFPISGFILGEYKNYRIDRTFVDANDIRWIIDYKTSNHEGGSLDAFLDSEVDRYEKQLNDYAELMQKIDGRNIKLGMYFPLMQAWREWNYVAE